MTETIRLVVQRISSDIVIVKWYNRFSFDRICIVKYQLGTLLI